MEVVRAANQVERAIAEHIANRIDHLSKNIVTGVPVERYKECCAVVHELKALLGELPKVVKKAKDG